jgi:uncharacterized protein YyaL (SSP411 family)
MKLRRIPQALVLFFAAAAALQAQEETVDWLNNYKEAIAEAKRTQKPIFLEYRCEP